MDPRHTVEQQRRDDVERHLAELRRLIQEATTAKPEAGHMDPVIAIADALGQACREATELAAQRVLDGKASDEEYRWEYKP